MKKIKYLFIVFSFTALCQDPPPFQEVGESKETTSSVTLCKKEDYGNYQGGLKCADKQKAQEQTELSKLKTEKEKLEAEIEQCKKTSCNTLSRLQSQLNGINKKIPPITKTIQDLNRFKSNLSQDKKRYDSAIKEVGKQNKILGIQTVLYGAAAAGLTAACAASLGTSFSCEAGLMWCGSTCAGALMAGSQAFSAQGDKKTTDNIEMRLTDVARNVSNPHGGSGPGISPPLKAPNPPSCYGSICFSGTPPDIKAEVPLKMQDVLSKFCKKGKDCVTKVGKDKARIDLNDFNSELVKDNLAKLPLAQKKAFDKIVNKAHGNHQAKLDELKTLLEEGETQEKFTEEKKSTDKVADAQQKSEFKLGGQPSSVKTVQAQKKDTKTQALKRNLSGLFDQFQTRRKKGSNHKPKSITLGNDTVGSSDDNIFDMVHRRYKEREKVEQFILPFSS